MGCNTCSTTTAERKKKTKLKLTATKVNKVTKAVEETVEMPYERLYNKVQENKRKREQERGAAEPPPVKKKNASMSKQPKNSSKDTNLGQASQAMTLEDDNYVDMDISGIRSVFPSEDEDEESEY